MKKVGLITFGIGFTIVGIGLISLSVGMIWVIALGALISLSGVVAIGLEEKRKGDRWKAHISFFIAGVLGLVFCYLANAQSQFY